MLIQHSDIVLFQGDSVTDVGRDRNNFDCWGNGYPKMIAATFTAKYPSMNVQFLNRGISGNRVKDLLARWDEDCIALKPTVVSILIGINDTWRRFDNNDPTSTEAFLQDYTALLTRVKNELGARIILMDPFVLPTVPERGTPAWREDLNPRIDGVRNLARAFNATYVPLDGIFAAACTKASCATWAADGVHPTAAGHALIAKAWMDAVEG